MHVRVLTVEQAACHNVRAPELARWFVEAEEKGTSVPAQANTSRWIQVCR
ncbi:hypothetical protein PC116_g18811 [Phytophthora cactorum]|uniref:Uncharacterized protein n=1 Tax=Phytophthora cactorum TaxID=29920 RepID=A0A8T1KB70_9STRA|nr:hypothetical protein PC114_g15955 [Phytophthora cactorum]KAG2921304.1 hypothetical protein PC117_g16276 [Phytophthora cactorum]KAG3004579.1 hypothetical protein PC119_g15581 [Phytophthora cactorum]KAG3011525.1 hypothetical protein PC120_g14373 [Phytophthora cactorum]KAG3151451.1 hypothetical protein C6341_g16548 [Phytophthora cactorum]